MKTIKHEIEGKEYEIRELDTDSALKLANVKDMEKAVRMILNMSITGDIDWTKTPARVGLELMNEINELNGFTTTDFTTVPETLPKVPSGK